MPENQEDDDLVVVGETVKKKVGHARISFHSSVGVTFVFSAEHVGSRERVQPDEQWAQGSESEELHPQPAQPAILQHG